MIDMPLLARIKKPAEPSGHALDVEGCPRQSGSVLPIVVRAEQQFQIAGQQDPDVSPGTAAVASVRRGKRFGAASDNRRIIASSARPNRPHERNP
jgi:hypothetical protein